MQYQYSCSLFECTQYEYTVCTYRVYLYHPYQLCHYYQFYLRDLLVTTINFVIFNTNIAIHCQLHAVHNYALNFITVECRDVHGLCHIIINCTAIVNWPTIVLVGHLRHNRHHAWSSCQSFSTS